MRKKSKKVLGAVSVFFFMLLGAGFLSPALAQEFSADMISTVGKETTQYKLNVSGGKIRMDMKDGIIIVRNDKGVSWMLMPGESMYMENPIDTSKVPKTSKDLGGEIERTSLGVETVDGKPAEKFKVTYTKNGKQESVYQWLVDNEIPVKVAAVDGSWSTEYKNLSMGAQPASLFEIPSRYTKMSMPSLGDMMGMGGY